LFLVLSLNGCIKDDKSGNCPDSAEIQIAPSILRGRITGDSFDTGDQIGLYVAVSPGTPAVDNYAANVEYTFDGNQWTAPGGSFLPWPGTNLLDLYAYWPYNPELSSRDPASYNFNIGTDQTTQDKYLENDFLWARSEGASSGETVPLVFSHLMARVQLNFRSAFDAGANWPQGAEVNVTGLSGNMTIDLSDGNITLAPGGTFSGETTANPPPKVLSVQAIDINERLPREESDLFPWMLSSPVSGYDISLAAIVMPQEVQGGSPLVKIALDGKNYVYTPGENFSFVSGETLSINLTLTNQPPGLILDLDQIDWSLSRVWNVYNGDEIVAQVCREYLQGPSAADTQAVVVYLANNTGVDFSSGFAARIYQRDKNTDGDYNIATQSVHGGSVNFDASTLYTQGMLNAVRKVAVDPGNGIYGSYNAATVNLTVRPATVSDYDGNTYPVVKINRWYWMASNLRTTHYRNGNVLTGYSYAGDASNTATYGLLYTGYTATDPQGHLPSPWLMPYQEHYDSMIAYLQPAAGSKIKANTLWTPTDGSDDVTGFRMLPGGYRNGRGVYFQLGTIGYLWTDTFNGFEGVYYTANATTSSFDSDLFSYDQAMSVRYVLTQSSGLTAK